MKVVQAPLEAADQLLRGDIYCPAQLCFNYLKIKKAPGWQVALWKRGLLVAQ